MASDHVAIRVCRHIKRGLYANCRYPAFTQKFIRNEVDRPNTAPHELKDYQDNCVRSKRGRAVCLLFVYISYSLKNLFLVVKSLAVFDYENHENNVRPVRLSEGQLARMNYGLPADTLKSISCLLTNCSRLGPAPAQLAEDAAKLPLFMMCHPTLDRIYTPVEKLDAFGILAFLVSMYTVFLYGCCTTILQMLWPASNDLIMFVTSPQVTAAIVRRRAERLLNDLALSYQNYRAHAIWPSTGTSLGQSAGRRPPASAFRATCGAEPALAPQVASLPAQPRRRLCLQSPPIFFGPRERFAWPPEQRAPTPAGLGAPQSAGFGGPSARLGVLSLAERSLWPPEGGPPRQSPDFERLVDGAPPRAGLEDRPDPQMEAAISNCMPLVRTDWWRRRMAQILAKMLAVMLAGVGLIGLSFFAYIQYRLIQKRALLAEFGREMARMNCHVWHASALRLDPEQALQIGELDLTWTKYALWETGTLNYLSGFSIAFMFTYYWAIVCEIEVWLAELRMFILATLMVTRLDYDHSQQLRGQLDGEGAEIEEEEEEEEDDDDDDDDDYDDDHEEEEDEEDEDEDEDDHHHHHHHHHDAATAAAADGYFDGLVQRRSAYESPLEDRAVQWWGQIEPEVSWIDSWAGLETDCTLSMRRFYNVPNLRRQFQESTILIQVIFIKRIERRSAALSGASAAAAAASPKGRPQFDYHLLGSKQNDRCYMRQFLADTHCSPPTVKQDPLAAGFDRAPARRLHLNHQRLFMSEQTTSYDIETLEQVYVNFRLLVEHMHKLGPSMTVVVVIAYLLNYGLVLTAVICRRKFANFIAEPTFVMVVGFTIANYFIFLAANFHSNAKKLQPLLWSMIAQLTHSRSLRVRHMRSLWLKQVQILDDQGGLALNAIGVRVTYVNTIQLMIWTSTIFALALKSQEI